MASSFLSRVDVFFEAASVGSGAFEEVDVGITWILLRLQGERRRLQKEEIDMLRERAGQWERWVALLETHCLLQLQLPDVASGLLLPSSAAPAAEAVLRETRLGAPALRCEEVAASVLPVFAARDPAPTSAPVPAVPDDAPPVGLGRCPGVLFLPSGPALWERRALLRGTWLGDFPGMLRPLGGVRDGEPEAVENCLDYFFLTGWPSSASLRQSLSEERERFADIITDCSMQDGVPHYGGLQHKFFKAMLVQQRLFPHAEYFVRASDDTYLHAPRLMGLVDKHGPHRLYLGREVSGQKYKDDWPLHAEYVRSFGHDRLPTVMVGDVMVLSEDLVRLLLASRQHLRHWAHFDDTVGVWLAAAEGVRRVGALAADKEWVEWFEVMRGVVGCPTNELVVAHTPAWKDWQNPAMESLLGVVQGHRREEDHGIVLEFMMTGLSKAVRSSGDPCLLDEENYYVTYQKMMHKLVKLNWEKGHRMTDMSTDVLHGQPKKAFVGFDAVPIDGIRVQK